MANVVVSAIATFNGKALKKGQKDISAFDKQTQKLGKTFNRVFAGTALVAFGKKAINAFAADEKAAKSLAVQLQNTGNAFRITEVETYIAGLQNLYKVLDDQLRPAFQTLLNATGSVTLSQQALETALNVSAGTGASLETVISAIAAGVRGQTKAIKGLNTGIDANVIASGDMNKIMLALENRFKGQALARLDTYAGKMDTLKVAAADATEIIGKGLVNAITALGKDDSIQNAADSMNSFALAIADTITGMGILVGEVKKFANTDIGKILIGLYAITSLSRKALAALAVGVVALDIGRSNTSKTNVGGYSGIPDLRTSQALLKARKEEYKIITKKNELENKNVEELKKKFDLERIGLTAALAKATDEETRLRIRGLLAILDNNDALAKKILAEMEAAAAAKKLAIDLGAVSTATIDYFKKLSESLVGTAAYFAMTMQQILDERLRESGNRSLGGGVGNVSRGLPASYFQDLAVSLVGTTGYSGMNVAQIATERARESGNRSVDVNLTVSSPSGDRFAQLMAESIQVAGRSGYSTAPNGGLP